MAIFQGSWYVIKKISWARKDGAIEERNRIFDQYSTTNYATLAYQ